MTLSSLTIIVQAEQSTVQSYKCGLNPSQHLYGEHKEKPLKIPRMMVMTLFAFDAPGVPEPIPAARQERPVPLHHSARLNKGQQSNLYRR